MLMKKENQRLALRNCNYLKECLDEMLSSNLEGDDLEEMLINIDHYSRDLHRAIHSENLIN